MFDKFKNYNLKYTANDFTLSFELGYINKNDIQSYIYQEIEKKDNIEFELNILDLLENNNIENIKNIFINDFPSTRLSDYKLTYIIL